MESAANTLIRCEWNSKFKNFKFATLRQNQNNRSGSQQLQQCRRSWGK